MDIKEFLRVLSNSSGISGHELHLEKIISPVFEKYVDDIFMDNLGNIIMCKKGRGNYKNPKIMIAAHMDEIGLMVKYIEDNGFLRFTRVGGIDPRTILGQEVIIHGEKNLFGVIGVKPPHLQEENEMKEAIKIEDMIIDVGYSKKALEKIVKVGDVISIKRRLKALQKDRITGKALDDKAGITAMYQCVLELSRMKHEADIYFVCTVQEEVGTRGAFTSAYRINPDIGIAVDVGFGYTPDLEKSGTLNLGEGPGITIGGNIHSGLRQRMIEVSKEYNVPFQIEITPGPTGTDARAMQITREGIPSLCLSIPLRYMHTSVEVIDIKDIRYTGKLLAFFISSISSENLEGLLCY